MNIFTSTPKREVIATVQYLPAVSIIMPFTPVITLKKNLECYLKNVMSKVEAMLAVHYTAEKAIPVIIKLKNLLCNLNYNTTQKSVAVFVSPVVERVYYFGVEMEEKIVIDPSFKTSDLVYCKKEKKEYLILLLSNRFSTMYVSSNKQLKLIKSNTICVGDYKYDSENNVDHLLISADQERFITNNFLHQMDHGLSIILKSYPLPVFVMGNEKLLEQFKKITKNDQSIIQFIQGDYDEFSGLELQCETETVVLCWENLKQKHLLKQIENARTQDKLKTGVKETLKATMHNKGRLLVVEKGLTDHSELPKTYESFFKMDYVGNEVFFIKDEVDDIIRRVFESGGDVEFVEDGALNNYEHIALIEN